MKNRTISSFPWFGAGAEHHSDREPGNGALEAMLALTQLERAIRKGA